MNHGKLITSMRLSFLSLVCILLSSILVAQTPWIAVRSSGGTVQQFQEAFAHWDDGARWDGNYGLPDEVKNASRFKVDSVRVINDSTAVVYSSALGLSGVKPSKQVSSVFPDTLKHAPMKKSKKKLPALKILIQENFPQRQMPESLPVLDYPSTGKRRDAEFIPMGISGGSKDDPPSATTGIWWSWLVILGFGALAYRFLASRTQGSHAPVYVSK